MTNGVIETGRIVGGPANVTILVVWALIVVPCGMDAMRTRLSPRTGTFFVAGTCTQRPGSKWMPVAGPSALPVAGLVTSLIA